MPYHSAAQMQSDNPFLSPLRKGGVKKSAKTCPPENGEKEFLYINTIRVVGKCIFRKYYNLSIKRKGVYQIVIGKRFLRGEMFRGT